MELVANNRKIAKASSLPSKPELDVILAHRLDLALALYPNQTLSPESCDAFLDSWARIVVTEGLDRFEMALTAACDACKFFPHPAEIRQHLPARPADTRLRDEMRSLQARADAGEEFYCLADVLKSYRAQQQPEEVTHG